MNATDPMAAIGNYINAFNNGDGEGMAAMFTVPGSILDGMAPHVWQGPTATQDWYRDVLIEGEQHGASGYVVTLGEPLHNNITGDSAYVRRARVYDIQGAGQAGYANRRALYGCPSQACRRLANCGLGMVEGHSIRHDENRNRPCSNLTTSNTFC